MKDVIDYGYVDLKKLSEMEGLKLDYPRTPQAVDKLICDAFVTGYVRGDFDRYDNQIEILKKSHPELLKPFLEAQLESRIQK